MRTTRVQSKLLVGLAATAGALGAAAMMSTAAAPTARADDFSDIITAIDGDFTEGNAAFASALSDFGSNDISQGLGQIVDGFDDYSLSPTINLTLGTIEALEGIPIDSPVGWDLTVPTDYADGVAMAQADFTTSENIFALVPSALASANYLDAADDGLFGADYAFVLPLEELLLGAAVSF